ncbi:MAG: TldD/PmbA family protein [Sphingomicrobium sp.]|nr:TldD/PmbA family protein [Sphingomonadales bacterium]
MLSPEAARDAAAALVDRARSAGADAADAVYIGDRSQSVQVRMGALEGVSSSESEEIGLRVFVGRRSASVASSALAPQALDALVERVLAMAREAPEDPFAGLAAAELLLRGEPAELDLHDPTEVDPAELKAWALEAESAALSVARVSNSSGCGASASQSVMALATSDGFAAARRGSGHSVSASVVAGEAGGLERDYDWDSSRFLADLKDAAEIGRRAGERAAARLDPVKLAPGRMAVLFDPRVATSLLGHFAGAITGSSIARKASFLQDKLGARIFSRGITIRDDPFRPRGLRSRAFDGEGLPTSPRDLIADGALTSWLADSAAARQLGIVPTGHAVRGASGAPGAGPSNLYLTGGARSREQLMAACPRAVLITELIGMGVNGITGDYSRGAAGFLVEHGEIVGPIAEITIAANLLDMFATIEPASDLELRHGIDSPTVLIPEMTVAAS